MKQNHKKKLRTRKTPNTDSFHAVKWRGIYYKSDKKWWLTFLINIINIFDEYYKLNRKEEKEKYKKLFVNSVMNLEYYPINPQPWGDWWISLKTFLLLSFELKEKKQHFFYLWCKLFILWMGLDIILWEP